MIFTETQLKGAFVIDIVKNEDERGFFSRSWCVDEMKKCGLNSEIRQANISFNKTKGTLRGMHFQIAPYQEAKYVRCTKGSIYDVIIDLRKESPTFKQWIGVELSDRNYKMLYVPENFAHGFITLENNTEISYLMTEFYVPGAGATIRWNDPLFKIEWPLKPVIMSEKDKNQPDYMLY